MRYAIMGRMWVYVVLRQVAKVLLWTLVITGSAIIAALVIMAFFGSMGF